MSTTTSQILRLLRRDTDGIIEECATTNEYDGNDNLRILAVFMIMLSSAFGAFFPILSSKYSFVRLPNWCWFIAKFFGSGVIIATGFIHLLEPASEALGNACLGGTFAEYPWAFGICLMSLFVLFLTEMIAHHYVARAAGADANSHSHSHFGNFELEHTEPASTSISPNDSAEEGDFQKGLLKTPSIHNALNTNSSHMVGANHFSHDADHIDLEAFDQDADASNAHETYLNQILSVFILEFGIIFHSIFIGLSLAVAGEEFKTLFIVLIFHQMFEGLGLGTRIADTPWDESRKYTPWVLALAFTLATPIAIGIGIGVRHTFVPESRTALIVNGCFDAISAGILLYTGLVELMAHEFLYSNQFKGKDGLKRSLLAYFIMCWGAGLMALLGKWA